MSGRDSRIDRGVYSGNRHSRISVILRRKPTVFPVDDMNSHDERLHVWTLRVAKFTLGVGAKHCPIIQYESIGWAGGSATSHHFLKELSGI